MDQLLSRPIEVTPASNSSDFEHHSVPLETPSVVRGVDIACNQSESSFLTFQSGDVTRIECGRKGREHVIWWGKPLTRIEKMDRWLREMNMIYLARRRRRYAGASAGNRRRRRRRAGIARGERALWEGAAQCILYSTIYFIQQDGRLIFLLFFYFLMPIVMISERGLEVVLFFRPF